MPLISPPNVHLFSTQKIYLIDFFLFCQNIQLCNRDSWLMCISGRSLTLASNITSELELCRYISYDLLHLCSYFSWGMDLSCIWAMLLCSTLRGTSSQLTALLTTPWGPLVTCGNTTGKNWTCDSEHLLDMFIIFYSTECITLQMV